MTTCQYDTGSMYGCQPACSAKATVTVEYAVPCYGAFRLELCRQHVAPMRGRVYPSELTTLKEAS